MDPASLVKSWGRILAGGRPTLSIEITKECPLRCPGCYAFGDAHLGDVRLRDLSDFQGQALIDGVLELVKRKKAVFVSIVGGEPLVRFRELNTLLPELARRGVHTHLVTSAVRPIPLEWANVQWLTLSVSIDGLQPEHDVRRTPATYDRILKHIKGHQVTVHCTVTRQQTRPGYVTEFAEFWQAQPDVKRIWFSLYTPQRGEESPERLTAEDRKRVVAELSGLSARLPKLYEMRDSVLRGYLQPPSDPSDCLFAQTTECVSSDLKHAISPCQFGGNPDCSQCGCMASAGLQAAKHYRLGGLVPIGTLFGASATVGRAARRLKGEGRPEPAPQSL